jgi:TnpA family transposase
MAESCTLSYRQLAWATEWYLGDEQLQAANDVLVDYLHQLQLAAHWGTGAFSSSDGQRSAARGRAASADAMAREFGFRRGALNLVNWVSDQYSQYGTKVVSVAEREAIHTLEAILHTQLPIVEHTTDTHGATEIVFALFDLLGLRFIPRLRDAGDLLLHLLGPPTGLPVDVVMRSRARPQRILEHYDDLLRTAASLKRGWVPASLLITRLKNATPQSPLAAALGEYGRIVRTNFLLIYCADPAERARIAGQLNKGETLHALRRQPCHRLTRPDPRRRRRPPPPRPVPADPRQRRPGLERPLHDRVDRPSPRNQARRRSRRDRARARRPGHARARQLGRPLRPASTAAARRPPATAAARR